MKTPILRNAPWADNKKLRWAMIQQMKNAHAYYVSEHGHVYYTRTKKIRKPGVDNRGYIKVSFWLGGKKKFFSVHRLVASHFCYRPPGCNQINHITGVKTDNRASVLEWTTPKGNIQHSIRTGLRKRRLSKHEVRHIYHSPRSAKELALLYKVTSNMVYGIRKKKYYRDYLEP